MLVHFGPFDTVRFWCTEFEFLSTLSTELHVRYRNALLSFCKKIILGAEVVLVVITCHFLKPIYLEHWPHWRPQTDAECLAPLHLNMLLMDLPCCSQWCQLLRSKFYSSADTPRAPTLTANHSILTPRKECPLMSSSKQLWNCPVGMTSSITIVFKNSRIFGDR